ncbi:MAG: type II secretion system protein GspL [Myxococcota bacterium]
MARIVGLDIQHAIVRATHMRTTLRRSDVVAYVEVAVESLEDPASATEHLHTAIHQAIYLADRPAEQVHIAIDGDEVSLRQIELPVGAVKRISEVLPFELESVIPFDIAETIIDHQITSQSETMLSLVACAAPRTKIAKHLGALSDVQVQPASMRVGPLCLEALTSVIPELSSEGPSVLMDIREHSSDICIVNKGTTEFARTASAGFVAVDGGNAAELEQALYRTFARYRAEGKEAPVQAYLGGTLATDSKWCAWLSELLGCPTAPLPAPVPEDESAELGPRAMRSLALAAGATDKRKRVNLLQGEFTPQRTLSNVRQHTKLLIGCSIAIALSFLFSTFARWVALDTERDALQAQLAQTTEHLFGRGVKSAAQARDLLAGGLQNPDPLPKFDAFDTISVVSSSLPAEATHDVRRLTVDVGDEDGEGELDLQGTLDGVEAFDKLTTGLQEHECFQNVEQGRTTPAAEDRVNYQISAIVRCMDPSSSAEGDHRDR